eukprot:TRINITY_DN14954_c0_g1_i1.p2 TRINITY_DN14954_c0_g1~~TRINITY_DN14954_c0_g1_i1.p2  ORF type:complete len:271 (-),score=64.43 TRINITY_DN14954_c0_g1_i1:297-1109(-)
MFVSDAFGKWVTEQKTAAAKDKAREWQSIVTAEDLWKKLETIRSIFNCVFVPLRAFDGLATLDHVIPMFKKIESEVEALPTGHFLTAARKRAVLQQVEARYKYHIADAHLAAYALHPIHRAEASEDSAVMQALPRVCEKILGDDDDAQLEAMEEHLDFVDANMEGKSQQALSKWAGYKWWTQYGHQWPTLRRVAVRLLAQTASASICERAWSAFKDTYSAERNKLGFKKASDLNIVYFSQKFATAPLSTIRYWEDVELVEMGDDELVNDN